MRKIKLFITYTLGISLLICSCTNGNKKKLESKSNNTKTNIKIQNIKITPHKLEGFDSSGNGDLIMYNDKLLFADELFDVVFECSLDGKFTKIRTEKGNGPHNILGCGYYIKTKNYHIFTTKNWDVSIMNKNWERAKVFKINFPIQHTIEELTNNPSCDHIGIYEFDIFSKDICEYDDSHILIPISTDHFKLNGYGTNSDEYYKNSYILGIVNIETGLVEKMIGHRSKIYLENKYIPNFNWFSLTKIKSKYLVSFAADPKIYVLDKKGNTIETFGNKGKNMNTNYRLTKDPNIGIKNTKEDFLIFDYYKNIKYINETNILFRTYKKKLKNYDGLQIYQNNKLIGDIKVPKYFKVIGFHKGVYYAQGKINDNEITYYKFVF